MSTNKTTSLSEREVQVLVDELHAKAAAFNGARWACEEAGLRVKTSFNEKLGDPEDRPRRIWLAVIITVVEVLQSTRQTELRTEREAGDR